RSETVTMLTTVWNCMAGTVTLRHTSSGCHVIWPAVEDHPRRITHGGRLAGTGAGDTCGEVYLKIGPFGLPILGSERCLSIGRLSAGGCRPLAVEKDSLSPLTLPLIAALGTADFTR